MYLNKFRQIAPLFAVVVSLILLWSSCSPVRKLKEDQYLLRSTRLQAQGAGLPKEELRAYIKQKPNHKLFGIWRLNLQLYNLVNQEKFVPRYEKRKQRRAELNAQIAEKNDQNARKGKKRRIRQKNENPFSISQWLINIGEPPVIYDEPITKRSAKQMELYLINHGYFNANVRDTMISKKKKRADVIYKINQGKPYVFGEVQYYISDELIKDLVFAGKNATLIKTGELYNTVTLDAERDRITDLLKDQGYYAFIKNYVTYTADSSVGNHRVNIVLEITNPSIRVPGFIDSTIETKHLRYRINDIYVQGNYTLRPDSSMKSDTLYFDNIHYIAGGLLRFKPKAIKPALYIQRGDLYSKRLALGTYRRLADYRAFKFINIQFSQADSTSPELLNCEIQVSPMPRQSFTLQTQATNTQGNIGVAGDFIYQNRNLFKGLELFEIKLNAGLEVQRLASSEEDANNIHGFLPFNTLLFGPEFSLQFPKLIWPFSKIKGSNHKTRISSSYNFQQRPDYKRSLYNLSLGYSWKTSARKTFVISPAEINFVKVSLGKNFEKLLNESNNLFLKNSFTSQFITSSKVSWTYSGQKVGERKDFLYVQLNLENSGFLFAATRKLFKNPAEDTQGKYLVFGSPYSQFSRFDTDFRYYNYLNKNASLAYRFIIGLGLPYGNSTVMPFVRSFFSGGANDLRAWPARSIGPGSYKDINGIRYDLIGDIKMEWNAEYRLRIYKIFETALFIDAGNIWLRQANLSMPGGEFLFNKFYKEIAIGAGIGLRLNFDYFIIRLDTAHPMHDPSLPEGKRWTYNKLMLSNLNFNLGIGYPF